MWSLPLCYYTTIYLLSMDMGGPFQVGLSCVMLPASSTQDFGVCVCVYGSVGYISQSALLCVCLCMFIFCRYWLWNITLLPAELECLVALHLCQHLALSGGFNFILSGHMPWYLIVILTPILSTQQWRRTLLTLFLVFGMSSSGTWQFSSLASVLLFLFAFSCWCWSPLSYFLSFSGLWISPFSCLLMNTTS